jgi:hypothetical protein
MSLTMLTQRLRPTTRPRRSIALAFESIEKRLAPSPTLPLPPPHLSSMLVQTIPHQSPTVNGLTTIVVNHEPPHPCHEQPPDPC